ncbi:MAG: calcium-translocating P-type ATPase, PMCA-type [Planctomycetes bacterium]|nr:calcium-translocating P-type ATPase, PMCA-type [Planctomycetota bacterium]
MASNTAPSTMPFPGLTPAEVEQSRKTHGANVLTPPERDPWWKQWLSKFEDPVIRILIIAAIIQIGVGALKGEFIEGLAIVAAILLATTLAFVNEFKANREFDILNKVNDDTPVNAIRGGEFTTIPRRDVVVGDILLTETGEELPCDGEVLEAVALLVDESKLTGESVPVTKTTAEKAAAAHGPDHAYPPHRLNRGSMVVDGHGIVRVTAVGDGTEIGKTARAAAEESGETTPLNEQLERLSKIIGIVGLGIAAATFFALIARGAATDTLNLTRGQWAFVAILFTAIGVALVRVWLKITWEGFLACRRSRDLDSPEWLDEDTFARWGIALGAGALVFAVGVGLGSVMGWLPSSPREWLPAEAGTAILNFFMIAVVIIVVAVPEGLAMSVTLSLAYSMRKMTAQNTLVRKMHACETIGAATVICSDKTGTLTLNQMTVAEIRVPTLAGQTVAGVTTGSPAALVIDALAVNTTAQLAHEDGVVRALGNPTEGALLLWLEKQGVNYLAPRTAFKVASQLTFSTERKFMATVGTDTAGHGIIHVKGAPEIVLAKCDTILTSEGLKPFHADDRAAILKGLHELQGRAMRTIGLAYRAVTDVSAPIEPMASALTWIGYVGITDPIRPEVPAAVAACRRAGIGVKIVTGDTPDTAREIARQIGLIGDTVEPGSEMTGPEFGALNDVEAAAAVGKLKILARARPMDKLRLVRLLQDQREVVAVTGDGTNDAPALNHAKVGLAMGKTGTAVAKEAADIVLLDDSFGSIVNAVRWGRGLYENIQRFIVFQLTINVVALGIALLGPFVGVNLPLTVMQMLWVNLIMDTFAALALATEPPHEGVLSRPPRHPEAFIVTPQMARLVFGVGGVFLMLLLGLLFILPGMRDEKSPEYLRSLTIFFSAFVLLQFWNLFNARCLGTTRSAFDGLLQNKAFLLIAAVILFGQILLVQFGGEVFRTTPLDAVDWLVIALATSPVFVMGELLRWRARTAARTAA